MTPKTVTNPVYGIPSHQSIDVMVVWEEMPNEPPMPFSAASYDIEPYSVALYNQLVQGVYGPIGQYTNLTVNPVSPAIIDTPYTQTLTSSNAIGNYTITKLGDLPSGLDIINNQLVGTVTTVGTYHFFVSISDSNNNTGTQSLILIVKEKEVA